MKPKEYRGRPTQFPMERFIGMVQVGADKRTCATVLECSIDTIEYQLREKYAMTFTQFRKMCMQKVGVKDATLYIDEAFKKKDDKMLWNIMKNTLDWKDKVDKTIDIKTDTIETYLLSIQDEKKEEIVQALPEVIEISGNS